MPLSGSPSGEIGIFRSLNELVHDNYPDAMLERDLMIDAIRDARMKTRVRAFSHQILGNDGTVYLTNRDYRLMLGVLASAYERLDAVDADVERILDDVLETIWNGCSRGAEVYVERVESMFEMETTGDDGENCPARTRVKNVIEFLERSYPLGTCLTDPEGGNDASISVDRELRVRAYNERVAGEIRIKQGGGNSIVLSTMKDGTLIPMRNNLEGDVLATVGRDQRYGSFFGQKFKPRIVLEPNISLKHTVFPGNVVIARQAGFITLMMKDVLVHSRPFRERTVSDGEGNVAVEVRQVTDQSLPLSVVSINGSQPNGTFGSLPEVQYSFYRSAPEDPSSSKFGATVRTERASA